MINALNFSSPDNKMIQYINKVFSLTELHSALTASKESTPDIDSINYSTLQHLPKESLLTKHSTKHYS